LFFFAIAHAWILRDPLAMHVGIFKYKTT